MDLEVVAVMCAASGALLQAAAFFRMQHLRNRGARPGGALVAGLQLAAIASFLAWVVATIVADR